jgi:hypothetical protein
VANILDDVGDARREYDEAEAEIERRREAPGLPTIDWAPDAPDAAERLAALPEPTAEQEAADDNLLALFDDLDKQRRRERSAYGEALKAAIEQRIRSIDGLAVAVNITVELEPSADDPWLNIESTSLETQLINAAILDTPTPVDLPRTPLERLQAK